MQAACERGSGKGSGLAEQERLIVIRSLPNKVIDNDALRAVDSHIK
jgi:hypothetical protein